MFTFLCRSGMAVPGIERELFRELPAALPGEPRITTEVLLQVSSNTSPRTLSQIDANMFKCISGNTFCCFFRHCLSIFWSTHTKPPDFHLL